MEQKPRPLIHIDMGDGRRAGQIFEQLMELIGSSGSGVKIRVFCPPTRRGEAHGLIEFLNALGCSVGLNAQVNELEGHEEDGERRVIQQLDRIARQVPAGTWIVVVIDHRMIRRVLEAQDHPSAAEIHGPGIMVPTERTEAAPTRAL